MVLSAGEIVSETYCFNADTSEGNYTILNNTCIRDSRLSLKAKGLHTYFMSLPPKWNLYKSELVKHSRDGMESVNSAIKELVKFGYVEITEQQRTSSGKFSGKAYGFHAKPIKDISEEHLKDSEQNPSDVEHRQGFPATVKPSTVKPLTENPQLLTTNKLTTDEQRTKLTNLKSGKVSESVLKNIIISLFSGEYPFDKNFESAVLKHLADAGIEEINLESYLKYVFERTKLGNVQKSFEGLFRKLALANSIIRDFKNSCFMKKSEEKQDVKRHIKYIDCPICSTRFDEIHFGCPTCGLSLREMDEPSSPEFIARRVLYEMSEEEREKYESALFERLTLIKNQTRRSFLTENEKIQFWKEYGILTQTNKE